jgi:pimeloyl-ACP methyl ester carboxylesterase
LPDVGLRRASVADGVVRYETIDDGSIAPGSRVLLCMHGITDDTRWITRDLGAPLQSAVGYDHLLTFDYESFGTGIRDNASMLWAALHDAGIQPGRNIRLDIVTHSMGGLVARALIELDKGGDLVHALVMAGTPNAGSPLASAARFGLWLGSLGLGLWPGYFSKVAAWALTWVDGQANGLKDLQPGADFLEALNRSRRPASVGYFALAGNAPTADPQTAQAMRLLEQMLEGAADALLRDPANDLVVTVSSTREVKPALDGFVQLDCNHSGYFSEAMRNQYMDELVQWLKR